MIAELAGSGNTKLPHRFAGSIAPPLKRNKVDKHERFMSPDEAERVGKDLAEAESEMPSAVVTFPGLRLLTRMCHRFPISMRVSCE